MLFAELAEKTGQYILSNRCGCTKRQLAGVFTAQGCDPVFGLKQKRIDLSCVIEQHSASIGQCDVRSATIEWLHTEVFFKRLDLETYCRLRQVQLFRCLAETELFRHCPEDHDSEVLKARH